MARPMTKLLNLLEEPAEFGYEFSRWTEVRLATHLAKQTSIHSVFFNCLMAKLTRTCPPSVLQLLV